MQLDGGTRAAVAGLRHRRSSPRAWAPRSRSPATRSATTSSPITRPRRACWRASPRTTPRSRRRAASGSSTTRRPSSRSCWRSGCSRPTPRRGPGSAGLLAAFAVGVAVMPVGRTVEVVDRAPGRAVLAVPVRDQAGPGGPAAVPAVGDRLAMDGPAGPCWGRAARWEPRSRSSPASILAWALLTRRWAAVAIGAVVLVALALLATLVAGFGAWTDFLALITRVSDPITTPHNFTPGAVAYQLGVSRDTAALLQWVSMALAALVFVVAALRLGAGAVVHGGRDRQPAALADPVGPLRAAAAAAGGLAAGPRATGGRPSSSWRPRCWSWASCRRGSTRRRSGRPWWRWWSSAWPIAGRRAREPATRRRLSRYSHRL